MSAVNFTLRSYQQQALTGLGTYLGKVAHLGARTAFYDVTSTPYRPAPFVNPETPYVCIRIPTGGGKTIVAAHSVGVAAREYLQVTNPMVLWLVPSTPILDQTIAALRNSDHPYRAALAADFGRNVSVLSVAEALSLSRPDAEGGACIIVGTLQAFRVDDTNGRKVYQDAGALMDHFSGLRPEQIAGLEVVGGTARPVASLANLLRLHRPMVIVDEAHNARTALSFETLSRFNPSMVLELTATPSTIGDLTGDNPASNILFHVSAAELKAEEMIKLPIRLQTDSDWRKVIGQALDCQGALEEAAKAEEADTGEYIRPIVLFQAQSSSKTDPDRLTPEKVAEFLVTDKRIPREQIAIHATGFAELDKIDDIADRTCPVRYVITVQRLREGWDCPFAYVLCSVAELSSPTAVEQLLGRVLRMPKGRRKTRDLLNRAYAFVASSNFQTVAERLKDGLVDGAGFDRLEAAELVKPHDLFNFAEQDQADYRHTSDALPESPTATVETVSAALAKLPPMLKGRVSFDAQTRQFAVTRALSRDDRNHLHLALGQVIGADSVIERLFVRSNAIQASEILDTDRPPFIVPRLGIARQGELELFGPDHFLDMPWDLAQCSVEGFVKRFAIQEASKTGEIDVDKGHMTISFVGQLHDQLALAIKEPAWTLPRLVNWIDRGVPHPDVTKPAARVFVQRALEAAMQARGYSVDQLARYKYEARRSLTEEIKTLRGDRETGNYNALFAANAAEFRTSSDLALIFDEQSYAYNQPYRGARKFNRHYFPIIGDLKPEGEEFRCAVHLDEHPKVRYWVRNVDRKPNAFWLQLSKNRFYPDFVVMLTDGRVGAVEYKGGHLAEEAAEKRMIGNLWAEASGNKCVFDMPTGNDFSTLEAILA